MNPYIFGRRNLIHIIDIKETMKGLLRANKFLSRIVASGQDILFVGTKRQARESVQAQALRCNMHFVTERWLGGTLTNFRTIRSRLARLEEIEKLEENGEISLYSKKMRASLQREKRKMTRNLTGIRRMSRVPGALVVIDGRREHISVQEAAKLEIPTVCLLDTDSDPDSVAIPIPGNDDAIRCIELVLTHLTDAVLEGVAGRMATEEETPAKRRRSSRPTTARAIEAAATAAESDQEAAKATETPQPTAQPSDPAANAPSPSNASTTTPGSTESETTVPTTPSDPVQSTEQGSAAPATTGETGDASPETPAGPSELQNIGS
jgi:small subunit ribosomal protein S2